MSYKSILKYLAAVVLIVVIGVVLRRHGAFSQLKDVSLPEYLIAIGLLFFTYFFSGLQIFYLLRHQTKTTMGLGDTALLPFSMNVFGYVIPTNGGMIYSILFLKAKYKVNFVESTSIGFGLVFITLMLNGLIGLFFCFYAKLGAGFFIASFLFLLSPLLALFGAKLLAALRLNIAWLARLQQFLQDAIRQSVNLIAQKRVFLVMALTSLTIILLNVALYYWINVILGTGLSLPTTSIIILLMNISSLVRIVPGNLGVEELIASGIFSASGSDPVTGALVTLFLRAVNLSLTIPLGVLHTVINYEKIAEPLLQMRKSFKLR